MDAAHVRQPHPAASAPLVDADPTTGLSTAQARERAASGLSNAFEADTSRTWWSIVRSNVFTLFNAIVFACFAALLVLGHWQDALFGLAALFNTLVGCYQEIRAKIALDRLALMNAPHARVRRDGRDAELAPAEVVLGDILVLRAGDQIPADAVVAGDGGLEVDESMLTGEADPVDKVPGDEVLAGSAVVAGRGLARATRVGAHTYASRFAHEARRFRLAHSELRRSINRILAWVAWGIGPVAALVTNAQVQVHGGWEHALRSGGWRLAAVDSIAVIIAMIPLGLVLLTSIAFAVGAARLAGDQVLVQELPAVEGLARVDVVCLDKTGTLTHGDIAFDAEHPLDTRPAPGWRDALAWFGADPNANATAHSLASAYPVASAPAARAEIPFSSARKWSAVTLDDGTWVFGAPGLIFADATHRAVPWDGAAADEGEASLAAAVHELAATGRRTLVLAHTAAPLDDDDVQAQRLPAGLHPVALLTLRERVRDDAASTLAYFARQGVAVKIISGDAAETVTAIAREVGVPDPAGVDARTLPGDPHALSEVIERTTVFGRVTPEQKKAMVIALQRRGHTVAMTGDGVNDALAIKQADIGIAMNSGAAATKAVARLVLLDGRFAHLPFVVDEGRRVIANIERVSVLFLTKTVYATVIAVLFGVLIMQVPFLPRQLSITDGLTIGIPAFFLALLPNARRYRPGFLRRTLSLAVPAGVVIGVGMTMLAHIGRDVWQLPLPETRTAATMLVAILGLWVLVLVSLPPTGVKALVVAAMVAGYLLVTWVPFTAWFFQLHTPRPELLVLVAWIGAVGIVLIGVAFLLQRLWLRQRERAETADAGRV
ncbi:HAD-IC family P-type ATPase [Microbacterium luticocti]|uniref:HAD-IC family P-type ATPase n=1 Tax=Microbacterium luticocti TaxID=451764 RepID=UPI0003FB39C7|nr:HAD-IC family P-type ATPase [Microbacterium luticocti]